MILGIKADGYNANYQQVYFDIIEKEHVFEIRDVENGLTFMIDKGAFISDGIGSEKGTKRDKNTSIGHRCGERRDRETLLDDNKDDEFPRQIRGSEFITKPIRRNNHQD